MRRDNLNYETNQACFGDVAHVAALYGDIFILYEKAPGREHHGRGQGIRNGAEYRGETDSHGTESGIGSETDKESDESDTEPEESGSKPAESGTKSGETDTDPEKSDIKPGETETDPRTGTRSASGQSFGRQPAPGTEKRNVPVPAGRGKREPFPPRVTPKSLTKRSTPPAPRRV